MFIAVSAIIFAAVIVYIATIAFISRQDNPVNVYFSLFLVSVSVWLTAGLIDRVLPDPSPVFITTQYRIAYAVASMATGLFLLFALGFYFGRRLSRTLSGSVLAVSLLMMLACCTNLIIDRAERPGDSYIVSNGDLYMLFFAFFILLGGCSFIFIIRKWNNSRGIDRARALYVLLGFGVFFLLAILLTIVLPMAVGRDLTSDYSFLSIIIPVAFTSYAILKYRLLDIRIALRRTLAYMLTLTTFGLPFVFAFWLLRSSLAPYPILEESFAIIFIAATITVSPAIQSAADKVSARILFPNMYDELNLLHQASTVFTETHNIVLGIHEVGPLICKPLDLKSIVVAIPRDIFSGKGDWLIGCRLQGRGFVEIDEISGGVLPPGIFGRLPLVRDDMLSPAPHENNASGFARRMKEERLAACLPVKGGLGDVAVLLIGEKTNGGSLDPADLAFLGRFAELSGIFVENHLLSTYLMTQIEEAREVKRRAEELDRYRTDMINIASHELRTPLTIINSYSSIMAERLENLSKAQQLEYLGYIESACKRLNGIVDQFRIISEAQNGLTKVERVSIPVDDLFAEILEDFEPPHACRIRRSVVPHDLEISTDPHYLTIILRNIIDNSIRYSPTHDPIFLSARFNEREVEVSVKDYGKGMENHELDRAFDAFAKLGDINKHHKGMGLGLYAVRLLARLLEIELRVESESDKGTTFLMSLPPGEASST